MTRWHNEAAIYVRALRRYKARGYGKQCAQVVDAWRELRRVVLMESANVCCKKVSP